MCSLFQECREYRKLESTKYYGQHRVLRLIPGIFGLYTIVGLLYRQLPPPWQAPGTVCWRGKSMVTFSDMLTCVRRAIWQQWFFHTHRYGKGFAKLSQALQATILDALALAA